MRGTPMPTRRVLGSPLPPRAAHKPAWSRLYHTKAWENASKRFLAEHLWCAADGCDRPSRVTDHIRPHKGDLELFWDTANWQPLCVQCHNAKSARE